MEFSKNQQIQDDQYSFPHHYIPEFRGKFRSAVFSGYGLIYASIIEFILNQLSNLDFASICDVGCGDGRLVKEISASFRDKEVCGIDYSERAINLARGLNPTLNYLQQDIINDPINSTYDVLTLIEYKKRFLMSDSKHCRRVFLLLEKK